LSERLTTLVRGTNDVYVIDYVLQNLVSVPVPSKGPEKGPPNSGRKPKRPSNPKDGDKPIVAPDLPPHVLRPLQAALEKKLYLTWLPLARMQTALQTQELQFVTMEKAEWLQDRLNERRSRAPVEETRLAEQLRDADPSTRLEALIAVAIKRPHREGEVIELLNDKEPEVRLAARQVLVRLARGTDFGPRAAAGRKERLQAVCRWKEWWAAQDANADTDRSRLQLATLVSKEESRAAALADQLVRASAPRQRKLLTQFQDGKDDLYGAALAEAIPQLNGDRRAQARDALVRRLARQDLAALRGWARDDDPEVRRAAALGTKEAKGALPALFALVEDPEPLVMRAAHVALQRLSGQDFGPAAEADRAEQLLAGAAWRGWWRKQAETATAP
jgi:hypothetical protein